MTSVDFPALLHDAQLLDLSWTPELRRLTLVISCYRRHDDGTPLEHPVELHLSGVDAIAAWYDPLPVESRPSDFTPVGRLAPGDLEDWSPEPVEIDVSRNSAHAVFAMKTACVVEALFGEPRAGAAAGGDEIMIWLESHALAGEEAAALYVACDGIAATSSGSALELAVWAEQSRAWWRAWEAHWAVVDDRDDGETAPDDELEAFIPAAAGGPDEADLAYEPPDHLAFAIDPETLPAHLLEPIRSLEVGRRRRDWLEMARADPCFDLSESERAEQLEEFYADEHGWWVFSQECLSWWEEGDRACVVTRAIEHYMPEEDDEAIDLETVIKYGLRKHGGCWIVWRQESSLE